MKYENVCTDGQMFSFPLKDKMLFGSFFNHAEEHDHTMSHTHTFDCKHNTVKSLGSKIFLMSIVLTKAALI